MPVIPAFPKFTVLAGKLDKHPTILRCVRSQEKARSCGREAQGRRHPSGQGIFLEENVPQRKPKAHQEFRGRTDHFHAARSSVHRGINPGKNFERYLRKEDRGRVAVL